MKTIVKHHAIKEGVKTPKLTGSSNQNQIKPDFPLSEKDEVKLAEERMWKNVKKKRLL